jgi:hypothetical protein
VFFFTQHNRSCVVKRPFYKDNEIVKVSSFILCAIGKQIEKLNYFFGGWDQNKFDLPLILQIDA